MKSDGNKQILSVYQSALAGAFAGTTTRFLLQPLDVLKVRFQLQTASKKEDMKYTSMLQTIRIIIKEEGVQGLWKGHIPGQCLSVLYGAVQFSFFESSTTYIKKIRPDIYDSYGHAIHITNGCAAGLVATVLSYPFDSIRTHLIFQAEPKVYNGMFDAARKIYAKSGSKGFTGGLLPASISAAPLSGLTFFFHEVFTDLWQLMFESNFTPIEPPQSSIMGSLMTGLLAGLCAKTVVYPLDLMKKRLQIQSFGGKKGFCTLTIKCSKVTQCFILTVKNEGFLGLFKGYAPTVLKSGATTSLYFTFYDLACKLYQQSQNT